jgi:NADH-quinone oxidoreductase subunit J
MSTTIVILSAVCALLSLNMLFAKSPVSSALSLLGVLVMTAGIYGMIGEHLVATIQLVVYAGAIMVLFIFSIMLLNLNREAVEVRERPVLFYSACAVGIAVFALIAFSIEHHFVNHHDKRPMGMFTQDLIHQLGGNSKVLAHSLFSQFYVSFEVISLALLVAIVGAVVLAKRKVD